MGIHQTFRIRTPKPGEYINLLGIDRAAHSPTLGRNDAKKMIKDRRVALAFLDGKPVGFLVWNQHFFGRHFVESVLVNPSVRRQGIARELLRWMDRRFKGNEVFSSTNRSNIAMQKVFKQAGYIRVGTITHLDPGDPEWIYCRHSKGNK